MEKSGSCPKPNPHPVLIPLKAVEWYAAMQFHII